MAEEHALAHLARYDALLRISKTLAGHKSMAELFGLLVDHLHAVVPFDYLALLLHEESSDQLRLVVLEPSDIELPFTSQPAADEGPLSTAWKSQKASIIQIPAEGALPPMLSFIRSQGRKVACWLPLTTANRKVGVLTVGSRSDAAYSDDVLAFMEQVAAVVAIAVDNGINYEQAQRYERQLVDERNHLRFLLDINNFLVSRLDRRELLKGISDVVQRVIDADYISIAVHDKESGLLRLEWIYDKARGFRKYDATLPLDRSVARVVIERGTAGLFRRSDLEKEGWDSAAILKAAGVESMCCVPLVTRNGTVGALFVASARTDAFSENDVTLLAETSAQVAIAVENARLYEDVTQTNARLTDEKDYLERDLRHEFAEIVGKSPSLRRVLKAVETVAPTDSTVLLLGETGTGKELIARAVHTLSARR